MDRDGSVWVLDFLKDRVAHFSTDGEYLGDVQTFGHRSNDPLVRDVVALSRTLVVLAQDRWTGEAFIASHTKTGEGRSSVAVTFEGKPVVIVYLAAGVGEPIGWMGGWAEKGGRELSSGPHGWVRIDLDTGRSTLLPGLPLANGGWIHMEASSDDVLEVEYRAMEQATVQPIGISLLVGSHGRRVPAIVSPNANTVLPNGIAAVVRISSARPSAGGRASGGRWYLAAFDDGSPLVWERIPEPQIGDEIVVRDLSVGPDGSIYLMRPTRHALEILAR